MKKISLFKFNFLFIFNLFYFFRMEEKGTGTNKVIFEGVVFLIILYFLFFFSRLQKGQVLGSGGFSRVYMGRHDSSTCP